MSKQEVSRHFLSCHIPLLRNDQKVPKNAIPAQSIGKE